MNMDYLSNLIAATGFKAGDVVLVQLWGENKHLPFLDAFAGEIEKCGAHPIKQQFSRVYLKDQFEKLSHTDKPFPDSYFRQFSGVTAVVNLMAYNLITTHPDFPPDKLDIYKKFMDRLASALTDKPTYALRLPTEEMAIEEGMEYDAFVRRLTKTYSADAAKLRLMWES